MSLWCREKEKFFKFFSSDFMITMKLTYVLGNYYDLYINITKFVLIN